MKAKYKKIYVCGVEYQHELGETSVVAYTSAQSLKKHKKCWKGCGIVELKVHARRWVEKQDLSKVKGLTLRQARRALLKDTREEIKRLTEYEYRLVQELRWTR